MWNQSEQILYNSYGFCSWDGLCFLRGTYGNVKCNSG